MKTDHYNVNFPKKVKNQKPEIVEVILKETKELQFFQVNEKLNIDFYIPSGMKYNPNSGDYGFDVRCKFGKNYIQLVPFLIESNK